MRLPVLTRRTAAHSTFGIVEDLRLAVLQIVGGASGSAWEAHLTLAASAELLR